MHLHWWVVSSGIWVGCWRGYGMDIAGEQQGVLYVGMSRYGLWSREPGQAGLGSSLADMRIEVVEITAADSSTL